MKKIITTSIITFIVGVFLFSCSSKQVEKQQKQKLALKIDSISIFYKDLDAMVRQELFDELNRIYTIRKIAAQVLVQEKLLVLEAKKNTVSEEKLLERLYEKKITPVSLSKFIAINNYTNNVTALERGLSSYDSNSKKGKELILQRFKNSVLQQYVDSLKTVYNVTNFLKPPIPSIVKIKDLATYYKGNLDSNITFLQISDLECEMCRKYAPTFNELYKKYKKDVRFAFTQYGSYASLSARALQSAGNQGKFWEMYDSIAYSKYLPEKEDILKIAQNIQLNLTQFNNEIESEVTKKALEDNFSKLNAVGIYGTPTIMINNKLIYNSSSMNDIEKVLIEEIKNTTTANTVYKK